MSVSRNSPRAPLAWLLALAILVLPAAGALPALAQGAAGEPDPLDVLHYYHIVRGAPGGDLRLADPVTRAEMAVLLLRALGREEEAQFVTGPDPFTDIGRHWARNQITLASRLGLLRGYPDGTFRPGGPVSYIESLALMLRLVGREVAGGPWPGAVIREADRLGIVPPSVSDLAAAAHLPAPRLHVFQSLYLAATRVPVDEGGRTLLQGIDPLPPRLSLDPVPSVTDAGLLAVTGTTDAFTLTVGGERVPVLDGRFRAEVSLLPGANRLVVEARDLAGNVTRHTREVLRGEPLARIAVAGPERLPPGDRGTYTATGYDLSGDVIPLPDLAVRVEGIAGTFDLASMTLTAGTEPGTGRLVFAAQGVEQAVAVTVLGPAPEAAQLAFAGVGGGQPAGAGQAVAVEVEVRDRAGQPLPGDTGRSVTLSVLGIAGAAVEPGTAATRDGRAHFTVHLPAAGTATLVARSDRLREARQEVQVLPPVRVVLAAAGVPLPSDGFSTATLTARLADPLGRPVLNDSGRELVIEVAAAGGGLTIDGVELRIPANGSEARAPLTMTAGKTSGTVTVSGTVASGQLIPVEPLAVQLVAPERNLPVAIQVSGPRNPVAAGEAAKFTVQVVDGYGQVITGGRYAFGIRVRAEHDPGADDRLPAGVSVRIGVIDLDPALGTIARTREGRAEIYVTSDRSGVVTVAPVLLDAADGAWDGAGVPGAAGATTGLRVQEGTATFRGTPAGLRLEVDSPLGAGAAAGALRLGSSSIATVRVVVVDARGGRVPGAREKVTLSLVSGTATVPPTTLLRETADGVADYVVRPGAATGSDLYQASHPQLGTSNTVAVGVQDAVPTPPVLMAARGARGAVPGSLNLVAPDEDSLELELETAAGIAGVRVYAANAARPLYESGPLDLAGGRALVRVPKALLPAGSTRYQATLLSAAGESARSTASAPVLNSRYLAVLLTRARYDAAGHVLTVFGAGFSTAATIDPARLTITSGAATVALDGAAVTVRNSGQLSVNLSSLPATTAQVEDPAAFGGPAVALAASAGWYRDPRGDQAPPAAGVPITPMASITAAHLDLVAGTLELEGVGFLSGALSPAQLAVDNPATGQSVSLYGMTWARHGDQRITVTLSPAAGALLGDPAAFFGAGIRLNAGTGWLTDGGAAMAAIAGGSPVYWKPALAAAFYDAATGRLVITGSGFTGAAIDPALMTVTDLDGGTGGPLDLSGATAAVAADGRIEIALTPTQSAALTGSGFAGDDIYVTAAAGWLTRNAIPAGPLPAGVLRLPDP